MYRAAVIKLTIYYVALLTGLAVVFSTTLYFVNHEEIAAGLESQVQKYDQNGDSDKDSRQIYSSILDQRSRNFAIRVFYYDIIFVLASIVVSNMLARETLKPLKKAHEDQIKFAAEASHQLRTPLQNMQLSTEVALQDTNNATKKDYSEALKQNLKDIKSLNGLTDRLLSIGRDHFLISRLSRQRVDIKTVLKSAITELDSLAEKNKVNIVLDGHKSLATVDKVAITQAFRILIENAINYSKPNSMVEISMLNQYGKVIVKVIDHGIGIKGSDLKRIFKPFYRSTDPQTQNVYGYGLGLPLAKQIIELHRGKITVISRYGEGSVFTVYLPDRFK